MVGTKKTPEGVWFKKKVQDRAIASSAGPWTSSIKKP